MQNACKTSKERCENDREEENIDSFLRLQTKTCACARGFNKDQFCKLERGASFRDGLLFKMVFFSRLFLQTQEGCFFSRWASFQDGPRTSRKTHFRS